MNNTTNPINIIHMLTPIRDHKTKEKIDAEIAKVTTKTEKDFAEKIEQIKLATEIDIARKDLKQNQNTQSISLFTRHSKEKRELEAKHANQQKDFKSKYSVEYGESTTDKSGKEILSTEEKVKFVKALRNKDNSPKYTLTSTGEIVGAKGKTIKSTIVFKHNSKKQTLSILALTSHLKREFEITKNELESLSK